jgi:hypothetical protein
MWRSLNEFGNFDRVEEQSSEDLTTQEMEVMLLEARQGGISRLLPTMQKIRKSER